MPHPSGSSSVRLAEEIGSGLGIECAARSDRGRKRQVNEDRCLLITNDPSVNVLVPDGGTPSVEDRAAPRFLLAAVADGLGGHQRGDLAASAAMEQLQRRFIGPHSAISSLDPSDDAAAEALINRIMEECREAVVARAAATPEAANMATTLTFAMVLGDGLFLGHAGDCRCYVLRGRRIEQITTDHTAAEKYRSEAGSDDLPAGSPLEHMIVNALGRGCPVETEYHRRRIAPGETVFLCSDGITRHLTPGDIVRILDASPTAGEACAALIEAANDGGGSDNITCVVLRVPENRAGPLARLRARWKHRRTRTGGGPALRTPRCLTPDTTAECRSGSDTSRPLLLSFAVFPASDGGPPWPLIGALLLFATALGVLIRLAIRVSRERAASLARDAEEPSADSGPGTPGSAGAEERSDPELRALCRIAEIKGQFRELEPILRVPAIRDNPHVQRRLDVFHARLHSATRCVEEMREFSPELWAGLDHDLTQTFENLREAISESTQDAREGREQGLAAQN